MQAELHTFLHITEDLLSSPIKAAGRLSPNLLAPNAGPFNSKITKAALCLVCAVLSVRVASLQPFLSCAAGVYRALTEIKVSWARCSTQGW